MHIKIIGAGPTGSILALAFARLGISVTLTDLLSYEDLCSRSRAYALTHSSKRLLDELNIWSELNCYLNGFSKLIVHDRGINNCIKFTCQDLPLKNKEEAAIGWVIDHKYLMNVILKRIVENRSINCNFSSRVESLQEEYDLIIAADGPYSVTRNSWNIKNVNVKYNQGCLTSKVILRGGNSDVAYEIFREEGPLAILPMGNELYQIVWSSSLVSCDNKTHFSESELLDNLAAVLPPGLEPDALVDSPTSFPLNLSFSYPFHRRNCLLVGESAHRCHPVGGQGLNLCWRDVMHANELMKHVKSGRCELSAFTRNYTIGRSLDVLGVGLSTDLIVRYFSTKNPILLALRQITFLILSRASFIRRFLLRIMTDGPISFLAHNR